MERFLVLCLWSLAALAADYPPVLPGQPPAFPRDHGSHPEYRLEWWYVTGWLKDGQGRDYGFQVTFFRHRPGVAEGSPSAFAPTQLVFAHATLSDGAGKRFLQAQRAARAGFGLAGAAVGDATAHVGDWGLERRGAVWQARVAAGEFSLALDFSPSQPPLLQGDRGYSRKGPRREDASRYYSLPQLAAKGTVTVAGSAREVVGTAWLDHEWSSQLIPAGAVGWDWVGINLAGGGALMAFRLRDAAGGTVWAGGSYRGASGELRVFAPPEVAFTPRRRWRSPRSGADYPVAMGVAVPGLALELKPLLDDQEVDGRQSTGNLYWEGAVRAFAGGREGGQELGRGYLELTGYGRPLGP